MKKRFKVKTIAAALLVLFLMTVHFGCSGPVQKLRFIQKPDVDEDAIVNIAINEEGMFQFVDKDGKPSTTTISFDQFVTRAELMNEAVDAKQQTASGGKKQGKDYDKIAGFKKIQTIEVYRRDGSVDIAFCIDNVCQCMRYNDSGEYCCPCNCICPN